MKKLINILINTNQNKLRLSEVIFDDKIQSINFLSDEFDWTEINTKEKLQNKILSFSKITFEKYQTIDGNYQLLIPGAIDPHVHFDTPGFEFREDFNHASIAAAFGGVTTIIDMPCTSVPAVTNLNNFTQKLNAVKKRSAIDFAFYGGVSGTDINDLGKVEKQVVELSEAGVAGFKVYVISGMEDFTDLTYSEIKQVSDIVKKTGKPLQVHAEDKALVFEVQNERQSLNKISWKDYCDSRSIEAEVKAIKQIAKIAEETGCRMHIVHLSSKQGLEVIQNSSLKNLTAETCPHYLAFTQEDFENSGIRNFLKTAPPVKFEADKQALWQGLSENQISFVTTDHAGCNPDEEKMSENFWEVYGGIPGVEHRVPFLFSEGFLKSKLSLEQTIAHLSTNAAKFYNLETKGEIKIGKDADFALIDLWESEIVTSENMHSKGKFTPFEGKLFNTKISKTILRGEIIMDKQNNISPTIGFGKFLKV